MANVQVIQRHAHLAGAVKLDYVNGREGKTAKARSADSSSMPARRVMILGPKSSVL